MTDSIRSNSGGDDLRHDLKVLLKNRLPEVFSAANGHESDEALERQLDEVQGAGLDDGVADRVMVKVSGLIADPAVLDVVIGAHEPCSSEKFSTHLPEPNSPGMSLGGPRMQGRGVGSASATDGIQLTSVVESPARRGVSIVVAIVAAVCVLAGVSLFDAATRSANQIARIDDARKTEVIATDDESLHDSLSRMVALKETHLRRPDRYQLIAKNVDRFDGNVPIDVAQRQNVVGARVVVGTEIKTGPQEKRRVSLPDGSILYVNEATHVVVQSARHIKLDRGDVFVEVVPAEMVGNKEKFVVETPARRIVALGTKFAVSCSPRETDVLVSQGTVQVGGANRIVRAGQKLTALEPDAKSVGERSDSPRLKLYPAPRVSNAIGWTRELVEAAEAAIVPASEFLGGAIVVADPQGQEMRLSLRKFHVDVHIEDGFARTTIDQTYFNYTHRRLEGTFHFPLPPDASLSRLAMYVNGKLMEGGMAERNHARNVFEEIRHTRRDPALLEWVDGTTFKMRIFPLEPRQEKRVLLSYTQRLSNDYGQEIYRFPAGHDMQQVREWSTHIKVRNGAELNWHSPSHLLKAEPTDDGDLVLEGAQRRTTLNKDLVLRLTKKSDVEEARGRESIKFSSAIHEGHRYLMMRYRPVLKGKLGRPKRNWVFLFESSADRNPVLARVQLDVIRTILENAEHDDTFNVITAGVSTTSFRKASVPCSKKNIKKAVKFLESSHLVGALDLETALRRCAKYYRKDEETDDWLVHVGSAIPVLGERDSQKLLDGVPDRTRYAGIGVGKRWDRPFMRNAAAKTGGHFSQINPDEKVTWKTFEFVSTLNSPRLLNIKVVAESMKESKFLGFSETIADGQEICAVTRISRESDLPKRITVTGNVNSRKEPFSKTIKVRNVKQNVMYLPRTWARLEIDRMVGADPVKFKVPIIELSKSMYVMSPFTSLLVLETEAMYKQYNIDRGRKDHWALYPAPNQIPVVYEHGPSYLNVETELRLSLKQLESERDILRESLAAATETRLLRVEVEKLEEQLKERVARVNRVSEQLVRLDDIDDSAGTRRESTRHEEFIIRRHGGELFNPRFGLVSVPHDTYFDWGRPSLNWAVRDSIQPLWLDQVQGVDQSAIRFYETAWRFQRQNEWSAQRIAGTLPAVSSMALYDRGIEDDLSMDFLLGLPRYADSTVQGILPEQRTIQLRSLPATSPNQMRRYLVELLNAQSIQDRSLDRPVLFFTDPRRPSVATSESRFLTEFGRPVRMTSDFDVDLQLESVLNDSLVSSIRLTEPRFVEWTARANQQMTDPTALSLMARGREQLVPGLIAADGWEYRQLLSSEGINLDGRSWRQDSIGSFLVRNGVLRPLADYCGGLETTQADIQYLISKKAEAKQQHRGTVDPKARKLIEQARSTGWESLVVSVPGSDRSFRIVFNGRGQFRVDRETVDGLREQIICDGHHLWHLYPELGLGAKRPFSRFHELDIEGLIPWHVPSVEELARGADVRCVGNRTVRIVPHQAADRDVPTDTRDNLRQQKEGQSRHAAKKAMAFVVEFVFENDGQVIERRLIDQQSDQVVVRMQLEKDTTLRFETTHDDKKTQTEKSLLREMNVDAPRLAPVTDGLVVLPLPYRDAETFLSEQAVNEQKGSQEDIKEVVDPLSSGTPSKKSAGLVELSPLDRETLDLTLVSSYFGSRNWQKMFGTIRERFYQQGDHRIGFAVLMASMNPDNNVRKALGRHDSPLANFIRRYADWIASRNLNSEFQVQPNACDFLRHLAAAHNVWAHWLTGRATRDKSGVQLKLEIENGLEFIDASKDRALAWKLFSLIVDRVQKSENSKPEHFKRLLRSVKRFGVGRLEVSPVAIRLQLLSGHDKDAVAALETYIEVFSTRFGRFPHDSQLRRAFAQKFGGRLAKVQDEKTSDEPGYVGDSMPEWNRIMLAAARKLAKKQPESLLRFAKFSWNQFDYELAEQLFQLALFERPISKLANDKSVRWQALVLMAIDCLMHRDDFEVAEELVNKVPLSSRLAGKARFWRTASTVAGRLKHENESLRRFERALEIEFKDLPQTIDLAPFRRQYSSLLNRLEAFVKSIDDPTAAMVKDLVARIVSVADRWRSIDPELADPCFRVAALLHKLGESDLAWSYWTTPLAKRPRDAALWNRLAVEMNNKGYHQKSYLAYAEAFKCEPTNPEILWHHAATLEAHGRHSEARKLIKQIADGDWQPRFRRVKVQAQKEMQDPDSPMERDE